MKRRPDWHARLLSAYDTAKVLPFSYGTHDCCLWAAYCVDAMCDTKFARAIADRFNYRDKDAADAIIGTAGGLLTLVGEFLGKPVRPTQAAPGDVVLARDYADQVVVCVLFDHTAVAPTATGLLSLPMERAICAWKV